MKLFAFFPLLVEMAATVMTVNAISIVAITPVTDMMRHISRKALSEDNKMGDPSEYPNGGYVSPPAPEDYDHNKMGDAKEYPNGGTVPLPPSYGEEEYIRQSGIDQIVKSPEEEHNKMGDAKEYPNGGTVPIHPSYNNEGEENKMGDAKEYPNGGSVPIPSSYEDNADGPCRRLKTSLRRRRIESDEGCTGHGSETEVIDANDPLLQKQSVTSQTVTETEEQNKMGDPSEYPDGGYVSSPSSEDYEHNKMGDAKEYPNGGSVPLPPSHEDEESVPSSIESKEVVHEKEQSLSLSNFGTSQSATSQSVESAEEQITQEKEAEDDLEINKTEFDPAVQKTAITATMSPPQSVHSIVEHTNKDIQEAETELKKISPSRMKRLRRKKMRRRRKKRNQTIST